MTRCVECGKRDASPCSRCGSAACDYHLSDIAGIDGLFCTKCVKALAAATISQNAI